MLLLPPLCSTVCAGARAAIFLRQHFHGVVQLDGPHVLTDGRHQVQRDAGMTGPWGRCSVRRQERLAAQGDLLRCALLALLNKAQRGQGWPGRPSVPQCGKAHFQAPPFCSQQEELQQAWRMSETAEDAEETGQQGPIAQRFAWKHTLTDSMSGSGQLSPCTLLMFRVMG